MELGVQQFICFPFDHPLTRTAMLIRVIGILAIVLGITMMAYTGFTFVTEEEVADVGPLSINKDKVHHYQWSPIAGAVLLAGGVITLLATARRPR